jgi:hypothetical protein
VLHVFSTMGSVAEALGARLYDDRFEPVSHAHIADVLRAFHARG